MVLILYTIASQFVSKKMAKNSVPISMQGPYWNRCGWSSSLFLLINITHNFQTKRLSSPPYQWWWYSYFEQKMITPFTAKIASLILILFHILLSLSCWQQTKICPVWFNFIIPVLTPFYNDHIPLSLTNILCTI